MFNSKKFEDAVLYRYYDKIINNIKRAETLSQLTTAHKMYNNHYKIVAGTIHFLPSKSRRVETMLSNKQKELI